MPKYIFQFSVVLMFGFVFPAFTTPISLIGESFRINCPEAETPRFFDHVTVNRDGFYISVRNGLCTWGMYYSAREDCSSGSIMSVRPYSLRAIRTMDRNSLKKSGYKVEAGYGYKEPSEEGMRFLNNDSNTTFCLVVKPDGEQKNEMPVTGSCFVADSGTFNSVKNAVENQNASIIAEQGTFQNMMINFRVVTKGSEKKFDVIRNIRKVKITKK